MGGTLHLGLLLVGIAANAWSGEAKWPSQALLLEAPVVVLGTALHDGRVRNARMVDEWQLLVFWTLDDERAIDALRDLGPTIRQMMARGIAVATIVLEPDSQWPAASQKLGQLALSNATAFGVAPGAVGASIDPRLGVEQARLPRLLLLEPSGVIARSFGDWPTNRQLAAAVPAAAIGAHRLPGDRWVAKAWTIEQEMMDLFETDSPRGKANGLERPPLRSLCDPFVTGRNSAGAAVCQETLAAVFFAREDWLAAQGMYRAALASYVAAGDVFGRWSVQLGAGLVAEQAKGASASLPFLENALREAASMRSGKVSFEPGLFRNFADRVGIPVDWLPRLARHGSALPTLFADAAEAIARTAKGRVLAGAGEPEQARSELRLAIERAEGFEGHYRALPSMALADLAIEIGRLEEARSLLDEALRHAHPRVMGFPHVSRRGILDLLQEVEVAAGRLTSAIQVNKRARGEAEARGDHSWLASEWAARASILSGHLGRHREAQDALEEALRLAPRSDVCLRAGIRHGLAQQHNFQGRWVAAERGVEAALEVAQGCTDAIQQSRILRLGSLVCSKLGDLGCAQRRALAAARAAEAAGDDRQKLYAVALAAVHEVQAGKLGPGMAALDRLAADPALDPATRERFAVLQELRARLEAAEAHASESDPVSSAVPVVADVSLPAAADQRSPRVVANEMVVRGRFAYDEHRFEAAERAFRTAVDRLSVVGDLEALARAHAAHGRALWRLDRQQDAISAFRQSIDLLESTAEDIRSDGQMAQMLASERQSMYVQLIEALVTTGDNRGAFYYAEAARARALLFQLGEPATATQAASAFPGDVDRPDGREAEAAVLRRAISTWKRQVENGSSATERARLEARVLRTRRALDQMVEREKRIGVARLAPTQPIDLASLQAEMLERDTTLISLFFLPDQLVAWVIDHEHVHAKVIPWTKADDELVACLASRWARGVVRGTTVLARCSEAERASETLWEKLVAPLQPLITNHNLVVVPHGILHSLPLAALRNPDDGRYWIEDARISYVPSASVLGRLRDPKAVIGSQALVLAAAPNRLNPLPGAESEAIAVAKTLAAEVLLGKRATESSVRDRAGKVDILHLAAHGVFDSADARSSRIELMPGGGHDGRLEVRELLDELRFPNLDLVVLSACRTAIGDRTRGDDIVGLVHSFMAAGAPTVVATLWLVDDEASADLMVSFYHQLLAGFPAADALRQAQLRMLNREATSDPYYWAAFGLYGQHALRRVR